MQHLVETWWSSVAFCILGILGLLGAHIAWAIIGGALVGADSLLKLIAIKRRAPNVPTTWRVIGLYAEALGLGVVAGIGIWACGALIRVALS